MAEQQFSKSLMRELKKWGHATRIENITAIGMPDVSYCINGTEGFIENKWRLGWPHNKEGIVTLPKFTVQQRLWISDRARAGGRVHVLLYVQTPVMSLYVFDGAWAAEHLGRTTRDAMRDSAQMYCERTFDWPRIVHALVATA